jgi:hypothetical protein
VRLLLSLLVVLAASAPSPRLVAPDRHAELQRGTRIAMTCPDIAPGRYVVRVTLTAAPSVEAHLVLSPPLALGTQRCIERAFARGGYAYARGAETIEHSFTFLDGAP